MKHYYIKYPRDFANEYSLYSVQADTAAERFLAAIGFERITRREAVNLCRREKFRREWDRAFSGYAPDEIVEYTPKMAWTAYTEMRDNSWWKSVDDDESWYMAAFDRRN